MCLWKREADRRSLALILDEIISIMILIISVSLGVSKLTEMFSKTFK